MLKKIKIEFRRLQVQHIEISEENGYDMPKTSQQLADLAVDIRDNIDSFVDRVKWETVDDIHIEEVKYIDEEEETK